MFRKKAKYTDEEILTGLQQGGTQRRMFSQFLFDQHKALIYKGIKQYRVTEEAAADLYTDAIMSLMRQIDNGRFKGESSLFTYLYQIFKNRCLNYLRDQKRRYMDWTDEFPDMPDLARNALEELLSEEKINQLKSWLHQIGETCQKLLWETAYYGYSTEEMLERMNYKDASTLYATRHRCLKRLQKLINEG